MDNGSRRVIIYFILYVKKFRIFFFENRDSSRFKIKSDFNKVKKLLYIMNIIIIKVIENSFKNFII